MRFLHQTLLREHAHLRTVLSVTRSRLNVRYERELLLPHSITRKAVPSAASVTQPLVCILENDWLCAGLSVIDGNEQIGVGCHYEIVGTKVVHGNKVREN